MTERKLAMLPLESLTMSSRDCGWINAKNTNWLSKDQYLSNKTKFFFFKF